MLQRESIHPPTILRLLRGIDGLPAGATGALLFAARGERTGTVIVENRRVCWAVASNMEHRLTDMLLGQSVPSASAELFEETFQECHQRGRPLGETLVARGLVTAEGLRCALRQHTAEAIARLSGGSRLTLKWVGHRSRRYDAEYTFGTPELLCAAAAIGAEDAAEAAARELRSVVPPSAVGLAFLADAHHSLPVAHVSADYWPCQSLVDLGNWARKALEEEAPDEIGSVLGSDTVDSLKRAWRSAGVLFVRWSGKLSPPPSKRAADRFDVADETLLSR